MSAPAVTAPTEIETARAVVYPWDCDLMGHFATRNYMRIFDDATHHLLAHLGFTMSTARDTGRGWVDVSHRIDYRKEILAGDLLVAKSSLMKIGTKSFTYRTRLLRVSGREEECAVLTGVAVHFDLLGRVALELPEEMRRHGVAIEACNVNE